MYWYVLFRMVILAAAAVGLYWRNKNVPFQPLMDVTIVTKIYYIHHTVHKKVEFHILNWTIKVICGKEGITWFSSYAKDFEALASEAILASALIAQSMNGIIRSFGTDMHDIWN